MCYHTKQTKDAQTVQNRFNKPIKNIELFTTSDAYNGFAKPITPIITIEDPDFIHLVQWGFPASWQAVPLLNAKIETLHQLNSFKDYTANRCLIIVNGLFEWRHEGKNKIKYEIGFNDDLFCLGGIFKYENNVQYYTIVTTEAQGIMREIHNTKFRMPIALNTIEKQNAWLFNEELMPDWDFTAKVV